ncbi:MAG TPA: AAA family ATPase [Candidatus Binataceae bacterium]|nr:AAA family ATPase [Candidatus Binataceae bacterium]
MFAEFYGLHEDPFNLFTQRNLYLSVSHRKALASLQYGIEYGGGVQLLLGNAGLGKTTLLRYLEARPQTHSRIVYLASTYAKDPELLTRLASTLKDDDPNNGAGKEQAEAASQSEPTERETKQHLVVLVDDAHELNRVELTRVLALAKLKSFETSRLNLVLAGRPNLLQELERSNTSGAFTRIWIDPLNAAETEGYINHRLKMATGARESIFTHAACAQIARQSEGVPRAINYICVEALHAGAKRQQKPIDTSVLDTKYFVPGNEIPPVQPKTPPRARAASAIPSVQPETSQPSPEPSPSSRKPVGALVLALLLMMGIAAFRYKEGLRRAVGTAVNAASPIAEVQHAPGAGQSLPLTQNKELEREQAPKMQSSHPSGVAQAKSSVLPSSNVTGSPPPASNPMANRKQTGAGSASNSNLASTAPRETGGSAFNSTMPLRSSSPSALPPSEVKSAQSNGQFEQESPRGRILKPVPMSHNGLGLADAHQARVYAQVGDDYMRLGRYNEAVEFYQYALALAPNDPRIQEKIRVASVKATE